MSSALRSSCGDVKTALSFPARSISSDRRTNLPSVSYVRSSWQAWDIRKHTWRTILGVKYLFCFLDSPALINR